MPTRIFIYDDSSERRDSLKALLLLNDEFRFVGEAMNCKNVISDIENYFPDVVLMDINMPEMDGFELTQKIRLLEQNSAEFCPIIAFTANALRGETERCLAAGMNDYLSKPLEIQALRRTLQKWLPN